MLRISVGQDDLIEKVKTDADIRRKFIANAKKLMDDLGVSVSEDDIKNAVDTGGMVGGIGVAATNTNINLFAA